MTEMNDTLDRVMEEANSIFTKMGAVIDEAIAGGATKLDVAEVAQQAGLEIDRKTLAELKIDPVIHVHPWLPWHHWWPHWPLWCWWWERFHPWYRCCRWWWWRCHWYPF
jgi:hypothetical protein